jgi:hypothetical protein
MDTCGYVSRGAGNVGLQSLRRGTRLNAWRGLTSQQDSLRVLEEAGAAAPSYPPLNRSPA